MEYWRYLPAIAGAAVLALAVRSAVIKRRARLQRDFTRKLETLLLPKETVQVVCPNPGGRWVLTSRRLIRETKEGFLAFPFARIKRLKGTTPDGKTTAAPGKMGALTFQVDKTGYTIQNTNAAFVPLVRQLKTRTRPNTSGKKSPKKKSR